jgi:hypothetical protein
MNDESTSLSDVANAVVLPSTLGSPQPPVAFELRRLPFEIRAKVARMAALVLHPTQRGHLSLISKEFHDAVAPPINGR